MRIGSKIFDQKVNFILMLSLRVPRLTLNFVHAIEKSFLLQFLPFKVEPENKAQTCYKIRSAIRGCVTKYFTFCRLPILQFSLLYRVCHWYRLRKQDDYFSVNFEFLTTVCAYCPLPTLSLFIRRMIIWT